VIQPWIVGWLPVGRLIVRERGLVALVRRLHCQRGLEDRGPCGRAYVRLAVVAVQVDGEGRLVGGEDGEQQVGVHR